MNHNIPRNFFHHTSAPEKDQQVIPNQRVVHDGMHFSFWGVDLGSLTHPNPRSKSAMNYEQSQESRLLGMDPEMSLEAGCYGCGEQGETPTSENHGFPTTSFKNVAEHG